VTDVNQLPENPNSTVTTHKKFADAAFEEEPPAPDPDLSPALVLDLVTAPDHGLVINN
jgi:hypothetical protein